MIPLNHRQQFRQEFFSAWEKSQAGQLLSPLENQLSVIIELHPEYHFIFEDAEKYLDRDYFPELGETNPFLHMSMHLAVQEQATTNRPKGYRSIYQRVLRNLSSSHDAEHLLMETLAEGMHISQKKDRQISDADYLKLVKKHLKRQGIKH